MTLDIELRQAYAQFGLYTTTGQHTNKFDRNVRPGILGMPYPIMAFAAPEKARSARPTVTMVLEAQSVLSV